MNLLPLELVNRILEYDGRIKYRNGKYMNQIDSDDDRYKMLQQMPQIQTWAHNVSSSFYMTIYSFDKQCCFEKYETLYLDEKPWIYSNSTSEIGEYSLKKHGVCYRFIILKQEPNPIVWHGIVFYLIDTSHLILKKILKMCML
jgi:hypothetical protein